MEEAISYVFRMVEGVLNKGGYVQYYEPRHAWALIEHDNAHLVYYDGRLARAVEALIEDGILVLKSDKYVLAN